jgi:hypothetical protein
LSKNSLVIFIKSFWLQKGITDNILNKKIILKDGFEFPDQGLDSWVAVQ